MEGVEGETDKHSVMCLFDALRTVLQNRYRLSYRRQALVEIRWIEADYFWTCPVAPVEL